MANRLGPASGYDFGVKRHYRRRVWATFKRTFRGSMGQRIFALLPSIEGAEIDVALSAGAREEHLIVIDRNPAIVATLRRRYPRLAATYGCSAADAAGRIAKDFGQIDAVNLDLCGTVDKPLFKTLLAWSRHRVIRDMGSIAVTALRGRERDLLQGRTDVSPINVKKCWADKPNGLTSRDLVRQVQMDGCVRGWDVGAPGDHDLHDMLYSSTCIGSDVYRSTAGTQTMLWAVFQLHEMPCVCDTCFVWMRHMAGLTGTPIGNNIPAQVNAYVSLLRRIYGDSATEKALAANKALPASAKRTNDVLSATSTKVMVH